MLTSIVGINWGDEGKGRMVDLLSSDYDIVVRYQGGNNAGHTVVNDLGKFILNLLPSGILRPGVKNVMGRGMVIDLRHLVGEISRLREAGVSIGPENLLISEGAVICMPYHVQMDCLEEERLADRKFGSTRRGIAPVYGDKYMKKAIRMGELRNPRALRERLEGIVEWKNLSVEKAYGAAPVDVEEMFSWLMEYGGKVLPFICDADAFLESAAGEGKRIMFEAQLGALRDIDYGIYPFTSSSSTIAAYAPIGAGMPGCRLDEVVGIMKAYSTCVGEGPFTAEWSGPEAHDLREAGGEYGAATGRPRRVGPFDAVASRYGCKVQGADLLALTKLDVLSYLKTIPVCVAYELDGAVTERFPYAADLERAKPVYQELPGWGVDISKCRRMSELPRECLDYIRFLEKAVGCPIRYVSVGPEREDYVIMEGAE